MKTLALRLYGQNDLRLESFDLPAAGDDGILARIVSNSICMSDHKAAAQGETHKRVPNDVARHPIILGHEFCGEIIEVGKRWRHRFHPGQKFTVQPALNIPGREHEAPGYSFSTLGGNATHVLVPPDVLDMDCLLPYDGDAYFEASLSEPVSCIIGAFNTSFHYKQGEYVHRMGIRKDGAMAILAGAGPMGLGAIDYALHGPTQPDILTVTDIDQDRLDAAAAIFSPSDAECLGVRLHYVNTATSANDALMALTPEGKGYDDVLVFAPVPGLIEQASSLLGFNGCLNFFAGPSRSDFKATINFYDVHYMGHHVVGSSGGNTDDMRQALDAMSAGKLNPSVMITHVGGLDSVAQTTLDLPGIPGGKKLAYTHVSMPMTAITDFKKLGESDSLFAELHAICRKHKGLWSAEAEAYLLKHAPTADRR